MDRAVKLAEDTGISKSLASKLLAKLYEKGLDAEWFDAALYRLECMIKEGKLTDLINSATDEEMQRVVDLLAIQKDYEEGAWASEQPTGTVWMFGDVVQRVTAGKTFAGGDPVRIQVMRVGHWTHPIYGEIDVSKKTLSEVKRNFDNRERGIDLAVDENHEPDHKALAWYRELTIENDGTALYASLELTAKGAQLLNEGAYRYFSPEIIFRKVDEESGKTIENLLTGGAFTNRPFFKDMEPLMASEDASRRPQGADGALYLFFTDSPHMKAFYEQVAKVTGSKEISAADIASLEKAFSEIQTPTDSEKAILANLQGAFKESEAAKANKGDDGEKGRVLKANEVVVDVTAFAALEATAKQGAEALSKLNAMELSESVKGLVLSEGNKAGRFSSEQSDALTAFMKDLSPAQRTQFSELVAAMPKGVKFGEMGNSGSGKADDGVVQKVADGIAAKMSEAEKAGKKISQREATDAYFAENVGMLQKYNEAMGFGSEDEE